jgi:hypothetical protein
LTGPLIPCILTVISKDSTSDAQKIKQIPETLV